MPLDNVAVAGGMPYVGEDGAEFVDASVRYRAHATSSGRFVFLRWRRTCCAECSPGL